MTDSDVYAEMIADSNRGGTHRYHTIEDGTHVDDRCDTCPTGIRPSCPATGRPSCG